MVYTYKKRTRNRPAGFRKFWIFRSILEAVVLTKFPPSRQFKKKKSYFAQLIRTKRKRSTGPTARCTSLAPRLRSSKLKRIIIGGYSCNIDGSRDSLQNQSFWWRRLCSSNTIRYGKSSKCFVYSFVMRTVDIHRSTHMAVCTATVVILYSVRAFILGFSLQFWLKKLTINNYQTHPRQMSHAARSIRHAPFLHVS